jgi:hypothetical protein
VSASSKAGGLYVYAVVPGALDADGLGTGIDGAALELVRAPEGVAAVVHHHSAPPYSGDDEDAQRRVLEHGDVVERCWAKGHTVLPMGFKVIVVPGDGETAEQRLSAWLSSSATVLAERLTTLAGLVELRVEISLDEVAAAERNEEVRKLEAEIRDRPPGVQRLLQRRLAALRQGATEGIADRLYPEYRRRLAALSVDLAENVRGHAPAGCVTVLNVAVLTREEDIPRLGAELGDIEAHEPAARVTFLGPWPPFSFADVPRSPSVEWTA